MWDGNVSSDMRCYYDNRFATRNMMTFAACLSAQHNANSCSGTSKLSTSSLSEIHQRSGNSITSDEAWLYIHMKSGVHGPKFLPSLQASRILLVLDRDSVLQSSVSREATLNCSRERTYQLLSSPINSSGVDDIDDDVDIYSWEGHHT